MKRFLNLRITVLLLAVSFLFMSCSKQSPLLNVVPKDSPLVLTINLNTIAEKGEMADFTKSALFTTIKKTMGPADSKATKLLEDMLNDPSMTGVDFKEDFFMFMTKDGEFSCFAIALNDGSKFEGFIEKIKKEGGAPIETEKDGEFTMAKSGKAAIGWNNEKILIVAPLKHEKSPKDEFKRLAALSSENSIASNDDFKDFYSKKKDVNFWMDFAIININPEAAQMYKMIGLDFTGSTAHVYGEFAQGEFLVTGKMNMKEEMQKKFGNIVKDGLNPVLLDMLPKGKTLAAYGIAIKPAEYFKLISDLLKSNPMVNMADVDKQLQAAIGYKLDDVLNYFGGDFVISFNGLKVEQKEVVDYDYMTNDTLRRMENKITPILSLHATVKDDKLFKTLVEKFGMGALKARGSNYELDLLGTMVFMGVQKNVLVITNSEEIIDNADKGFGANSMASSEYAEMFKGSPAFFFANINYASYPNEFKEALNTNPDVAMGLTMAMPYLEIYDAIIFESKKDNTFSGKIKLKDKNANFIKAIYDNLNKNIPKAIM